MKNTRKSLFTSLVTLLLCSAMFVGSTFAWFTDTVSNTGNKIQAGTLDVELWQKTTTLSTAQQTDSEHIKDVTEEGYIGYSNISDSNVAVFDYDKWEPGYSTPAGFAIKNKGNLALKYELTFSLEESKTGLEQLEVEKSTLTAEQYADKLVHLTKVAANSKLEEAIEVYQGETKLGTLKDFFEGKQSFTGHLSAGQVFKTSDLKLIMPTDKGNKYENASISFDIKLLATQYTEEYDGFGSNQYDALADETPDFEGWERYKTIASVTETIKEGEDTVFKTGNNIAEDKQGYTEVTIPKEVADFVVNKNSTIEVETTPILAANNLFTVSSDQGAVGAIDLTVTVDGTKVEEFKDSEGNPVEVTVKTFIAKGLTLNGAPNTVGVEYKGDGTQPTSVSYNSETGELVFNTKHFSQFLINADQVAYVDSNNTAYLTLKGAVPYANENNTVYLLKDTNEYNINLLTGAGYCNYLNLDMNGRIISCNTTGQNCIFKIWDATLNLIGKGLLLDTARDCEYFLISMRGGDTVDDVDSCVLNVGPDITIQSSYCCVLFSSTENHNYGSVLNLYGNLYGCGPLNVNGNVKNSINCPIINIYDGSYIELNSDLYNCEGDETNYLAGYAKTTIYDGAKIVSLADSACDPITICAGELYIKGGSFDSGNIIRLSPGQYGAVDTVTGNVVCIAQHSTNLGINVVIDGGTFNGAKPISWQKGKSSLNPQNNVSITINGGTFESMLDGYKAIDVEDTIVLPSTGIHVNGGTFIENGIDVTSSYMQNYGGNPD